MMHRLLLLSLATLGLGLAGCAHHENPNATQFANAHRACAEIGIDPASSQLSHCAAELDATLFGLSNTALN